MHWKPILRPTWSSTLAFAGFWLGSCPVFFFFASSTPVTKSQICPDVLGNQTNHLHQSDYLYSLVYFSLSLSLSSYLSLDMVVQDKSVSGSSRRAGLSCAECRRSVSLTLLNPWNHLTQCLDQSSNVIGMLRKSYIFS